MKYKKTRLKKKKKNKKSILKKLLNSNKISKKYKREGLFGNSAQIG